MRAARRVVDLMLLPLRGRLDVYRMNPEPGS